MQSSQPIGDTSQITSSGNLIQECCTGTFGSSITAQSPMDTTFIMQTATATIMTSPILNVCQAPLIRWSIGTREAQEPAHPSTLFISQTSEIVQKRGTVHQKALSGTGNTLSIQSQKIDRRLPAQSANPYLSQKTPLVSFAQKDARMSEGESSKEKHGVPVYDLMVEGDHEFFAYGVLVHNCLDALARIAEPDLKLIWPLEKKPEYVPPIIRHNTPSTAWMAS